MTTQKEIDEMFIGILENISEICDKTTSGNVSHNIATIKYKCRDMLQFYKVYPVSHWHSVKEGDLPEDVKKKVNLLIDIVLGIMMNMKKNVLIVVKDLIGIVKIITKITTKPILNV
jgi:hypothetical protein